MAKYKDLVTDLLGTFASFKIVQVSWEENLDANMLLKLSLSASSYVSQMAKIEEVTFASIDVIQVDVINDQNDELMDDMFKFLMTRQMLVEDARAKKVKTRAVRYEVRGARLYKQSLSGLLLSCVSTEEAKAIIDEAHEGRCSAHQGVDTIEEGFC